MLTQRFYVDDASWGSVDLIDVCEDAYLGVLSELRRRGGCDIICLHSGSKVVGYIQVYKIREGAFFDLVSKSGGSMDDAAISCIPLDGRFNAFYLSMIAVHPNYRTRENVKLLYRDLYEYLRQESKGRDLPLITIATSPEGVRSSEGYGCVIVGKTFSGYPIYRATGVCSRG